MHLTTFSNLSYKEYYVYEYNKWLLHINLEQIVYNKFWPTIYVGYLNINNIIVYYSV